MTTPLRILYAAGPGDVAGTLAHWRAGRDDPHEVSVTYSAQFFDLCRRWGAEALVVASHQRPSDERAGGIRVIHRLVPGQRRGAALYHLGQVGYAARLTLDAWRCGARAAVIAEGTHWYAYAPMAMSGVRVIPSLHCALWPADHRRFGRVARTLDALNRWFWRRHAAATICVSPECERQVRELCPRPRGPIFQSRANFRASAFIGVPPARHPGAGRFRAMYAGRIEASKGVFDLLQVAETLERRSPGRFAWSFCGDGSAMPALRDDVSRRGLRETVTLHGRLARPQMLAQLGEAHALVVPTTARFAEGLNKVAVEGVLAGRPVVTSRLSNAVDVLEGAVVEVPPGDLNAYADALTRLADDPVFYDATCRACAAVGAPFFDEATSWRSALERSLRAAGLSPLGDVQASAPPAVAEDA